MTTSTETVTLILPALLPDNVKQNIDHHFIPIDTCELPNQRGYFLTRLTIKPGLQLHKETITCSDNSIINRTTLSDNKGAFIFFAATKIRSGRIVNLSFV
jgi:hypothetical protein